MTIKLDLPADTEAKVRQRANDAGMDVEQFVRRAIDEKLAQGPTFAEILRPVHEETARLGWTEADIDALFEECREEVRRERQGRGRQ
jgi:hypothetical protein